MDLALTFTQFNLLEGAFWLLCAAAAFLLLSKTKIMPYRFWYVLGTTFVLFGISDFVEAYYPVSFVEPGGYWLFGWKVACIISFIICIVWYFVCRLGRTLR